MENKITPETIEETKSCKTAAESAFAEAENHALSDEELTGVTGGYDMARTVKYLAQHGSQYESVRKIISCYNSGNFPTATAAIATLAITCPLLWREAIAYGGER